MPQKSRKNLNNVEILKISKSQLNLDNTLTCGQSFRWFKNQGTWRGVVGDSLISVIRHSDEEIQVHDSAEDTEFNFSDYFSLDLDLEEVFKAIEKDNAISEAIRTYRGLRILNQPPFETLISYLCSANSNIPSIVQMISRITTCWGKPLSLDSSDFIPPDGSLYTFPTPEDLSKASEVELREQCRIGFRAPRILEVAKAVASGELHFEELRKVSYEEAKEVLMSYKGIGPKIADCVCLFSLGKLEAFPVDVWIHRIIQEVYFEGKKTSKKVVEEFGKEYFGKYAGYAQEYLFAAREDFNLPKKKKSIRRKRFEKRKDS